MVDPPCAGTAAGLARPPPPVGKHEVKIDGIDRENKRISLSLAGSEQEESREGGASDYSQYLKEKPASMGTLADLLKAKSSGKKK